ncbi:MAG: DUF1292 domain-containing protein [Candidatus Gastranaerophilales bacterium]|nr:DUF1292 domain-containing protein [Candidatus Gastranaerophilales bacterium]
MSDNNGSGETKIIKTEDENGNVFNFELLDIVEVDGQEYGLLVMLDDENESAQGGDSDEEVEEEVVIMRLTSTKDGYTFETIEDDEEFEKVISCLEFDEEIDEENECCCEFHHCEECGKEDEE